jgi:hypothetical protein
LIETIRTSLKFIGINQKNLYSFGLGPFLFPRAGPRAPRLPLPFAASRGPHVSSPWRSPARTEPRRGRAEVAWDTARLSGPGPTAELRRVAPSPPDPPPLPPCRAPLKARHSHRRPNFSPHPVTLCPDHVASDSLSPPPTAKQACISSMPATEPLWSPMRF